MILYGGEKVNITTFPNGESKLELAGISFRDTTVQLVYEGDADLIHLMLFTKWWKGADSRPLNLRVNYFPYSRMDRVEKATDVFSLKYVAEFINSLDYATVVVDEAHSDVALALIDNVFPLYSTTELCECVVKENKLKDYVVFYPDAGAEKRYSKRIAHPNVLTGVKKRNFQTGEILSLEVMGNADIKGKDVVIVDDLCSYGGTFIASATKLKELGASRIFLVVGHCEKSILKGKIFSSRLVDKVYTTNSIIQLSDVPEELKDRLEVLGG